MGDGVHGEKSYDFLIFVTRLTRRVRSCQQGDLLSLSKGEIKRQKLYVSSCQKFHGQTK